MNKFTNTLYTNDNLFILNGLNSQSVDLIYLDPPFNSKRTYSAPVGSKSAGASFKDMWSWEDVNEFYLETMFTDYPFLVNFIQSIEGIYGKAMMAYITYMTQRIIQMHRVLKETGSLYLHCDPTASHYLKIVLDRIFGKNNFRNEIVWCYSHGGRSKKGFGKKHDIILRYSKSNAFTFNGNDVKIEMKSGKKSFGGKMKIDNTGRKYRLVYGTKNSKGETKYYKYYLDEGKIPEDYWTDINSLQSGVAERTGYPTQKPLALLHRIIKASSCEGDVVFDPFCGCATACVAAQQLQRHWIGIDIEKQAADVLVERLSDDAGLFKDFIHRTDIPKRDDVKEELPNQNIKEKLYKEQQGHCNGCDNKYLIKDFHIDHIIPKSKGGGNYYENYQLLCGHCNTTKGDRPMEYLMTKTNKRDELLRSKLTFGIRN
ncbi:MAG: site-specific DNA-methyltransferase [Gammaproteobacteria bacterium]|nr:MAG: site-specific DNA-methyltransferase [Gammaproteobacteria bacterium]